MHLSLGGVSASIGICSPGEAGYMPSSPKGYQDAKDGLDASGWKKSMTEEDNSSIDHHVAESVMSLKVSNGTI